jgi:3-methyladenine DNA glycosylase AlkD
MKSKDIISALNKYSNKEKAKTFTRFFKTGKGQYGEGDKFLGIDVPTQRFVAKANIDITFSDIENVIQSKFHEHRLTGFIVLVYKYKKSKLEKEKKQIFNFYIKNIKWVNNWDLVDVTCPDIIGDYLFEKDKKILFKMAKSNNLWHRRIAVISTFNFIKKKDFKDTIKIIQMLLNDKHDLIHKACGWMLREIGKRDENTLKNFLDKNVSKMPRTMLRYSIEKFDLNTRKKYLNI